MVLLIIIPMKWLFVWEYSLFSDKPTCVCNLMSFVLLYAMCVLCLLAVHNTEMYCIYSIVYVLFHTDGRKAKVFVCIICLFLQNSICCISISSGLWVLSFPSCVQSFTRNPYQQWPFQTVGQFGLPIIGNHHGILYIYMSIYIYNIYAQQIDTVKKEIKREKFWVSYIFSGLVMSCRSFVSFAGHNDTPIAPRRL